MSGTTELGDDIVVVEALETGGVRFELLELSQLRGSRNVELSQVLYYASKTGVRLRQVRALLNKGAIQIEAGALHYQRGHIEMKSKVGGVGGLLKKAASRFLTKESMFKPVYTGTGEVYLEPGFGDYLLVPMAGETLVADKGMFYACAGDIEVGVEAQSKALAGVAGDEGWFQTRLTGTGVAVLESPVPREEIVRLVLEDETAQIDGNFALLRKGDVTFSVEPSSKSLMSTAFGGEGFLQTFRGTGEVWLAPTQSVYERLRRDFQPLASPQRSMGTVVPPAGKN